MFAVINRVCTSENIVWQHVRRLCDLIKVFPTLTVKYRSFFFHTHSEFCFFFLLRFSYIVSLLWMFSLSHVWFAMFCVRRIQCVQISALEDVQCSLAIDWNIEPSAFAVDASAIFVKLPETSPFASPIDIWEHNEHIENCNSQNMLNFLNRFSLIRPIFQRKYRLSNSFHILLSI